LKTYTFLYYNSIFVAKTHV